MKKTLFAAAVLFSFATVAFAAPVKLTDEQLALTAAGDLNIGGGCFAVCTIGNGSGTLGSGSGNFSGNIIIIVKGGHSH